MAEPSAVAPAGVAGSGPDVLLATKLHVPRRRPGFVPRPRLAGALSEGLARRLIVVCAPAGSGKTALLADWAPSGSRPVAWLSLDAADNDPVRFWRHMVAALDRACPGIGERVGLLLGPPAQASFEGLVTALINDLAAWPDDGEVLLVLDDYHLIDARPVHVSLAFLLEHLPPGLHLVLASRADPPLPLARLGPAGSWPSCAPPTCASASRRRRRCSASRLVLTCPPRWWRLWPPAPRGGWPACSWPPFHWRGRRIPSGSWRRSAAATAMSWTTWPRRCWTASKRSCAPSCWKPRC